MPVAAPHRRLAVNLGVIAAGSVAAALAMQYRTDVHVVVVTADALPAAAGRPDADGVWRRLAGDGVTLAQVESEAPAGVPTVREVLTGDGAPAPGGTAATLASRLAAAGWRCGAFVSSAALRRPGSGLDLGFRQWDQAPGTTDRDGRDTVSAAIGWLLGEAHEKAPNCLWLQLDGGPVAPHLERLIDALQRHGYWEQTLLLVTGTSAPSVAFVRLPHQRHGGERLAEPVQSIDLLPTLLRAVDLPVAELPGRPLLEP